MAAPSPKRGVFGDLCDRLRTLFGAHRKRFGARTVLTRGERTPRRPDKRYNKYSPEGRKHIRGTTDTGSDARCAPMPREDSKAMNPVDLWTHLNTRISTCDQEARLREVEARTKGTTAHIARALKRGRPDALPSGAVYHIRSNAQFFGALSQLLDAWDRAADAIESGVASCADDPRVAEAVKAMRTTMGDRAPALRKKAEQAMKLADAVLRPRTDPARRALDFK